jgi:hypothetical protein
MKDEMIQLYLNNSAAAAREVCLLGAPRCRGIGMVLGALGVSEDQVRDALLEGNALIVLPYNVHFCSVSDVCQRCDLSPIELVCTCSCGGIGIYVPMIISGAVHKWCIINDELVIFTFSTYCSNRGKVATPSVPIYRVYSFWQ